MRTEALWQAAKILTDRKAPATYKLAAMRFLIAADKADILAELGMARLGISRERLAALSSDATDDAGGVADQLAI
jgi:hypothetical protein